jgi:hypothetical protein
MSSMAYSRAGVSTLNAASADYHLAAVWTDEATYYAESDCWQPKSAGFLDGEPGW